MGAADLPLNGGSRIGLGTIYQYFSTKRFGQRQFLRRDIDGGNTQSHGSRILHGDVPQSADADDRHPLAGPGTGALQAAIGGNSSAENGGHGKSICALRQARHEGSGCHHVFSIAAGLRIAGGFGLLADGLHAGETEFAKPAGRKHPRHADFIAHREIGDARPKLHHLARHLVAGNERQSRRRSPVAIDRMQIAVTDAAGGDPDQQVTMAWLGYRNLFDHQRCLQGMQDSGFHGLGHHRAFAVFSG